MVSLPWKWRGHILRMEKPDTPMWLLSDDLMARENNDVQG